MNLSYFFKDLKIVELASVLAGPSVGMFFAELGAQVIKIENKTTGGDVTRKWKLASENPDKTDSAYYHSINWGKESLFLDVKNPDDYQTLIEHIRDADIVLSNFKADSAKRLRLDYETLQKYNESIIYGSITAYGKEDNRPGFDVLMQAETGWLSMNGESGRGAVKLPVALMDILTAHQLKEGLLVALLHREKTGKGSHVHAALFDSGVAALANQASNWLNVNHLPKRMGSQHPNIAPYGDILLSKEKTEIILSPGTTRQFENLLKALDLEKLKDDPKFTSNAARLEHRSELMEILNNTASNFTTEILLQKLNDHKVPAAPIQNLEMLFNQPAAKGLLLHGKNEAGGDYRVVKSAVFDLNDEI